MAGKANVNKAPAGVMKKPTMPVAKGMMARAERAPHSKGLVARSSQGGFTSPVDDSGGGVGNTPGHLDRMLKGS